MISSDIIRGYNDTIILSLLLEEPSYGYEVSRTIRQRTDSQYVIKETTLYSAFNRLESNGFIQSFSGTESQGKPRTYYRITEAGKQHYRAKCAEWAVTQTVISRFVKEMH